MIRKYAIAACALALPMGAVAFGTGAASASVRPHTAVTYTGTVKCSTVTAAKITLVPGLTNTASTKAIVVHVTGTVSGCKASAGKSQGGATLSHGVLSGKGSLPKGSTCLGLASSGAPSASGTITWKSSTTTTINPTDVSLTAGAFNVSSTPVTATFTATQTGSFATSSSGIADGVSVTVKQTLSEILASCGATGGLKTINLMKPSSVQ